VKAVDPKRVLSALKPSGPATEEALRRCGDLAAVAASLPAKVVSASNDGNEYFEPPLLVGLYASLIRRRAQDEHTFGPMARCATAIGLGVAIASQASAGRLPHGSGIICRKRSALGSVLARLEVLIPTMAASGADQLLSELRPQSPEPGVAPSVVVDAMAEVLDRIEEAFAGGAPEADALEALAGSIVQSLWAQRGH